MLDRTGSGLSQHTLDLRFIPRLHEILHAQDRHRQLDRNFNGADNEVNVGEINPVERQNVAGHQLIDILAELIAVLILQQLRGAAPGTADDHDVFAADRFALALQRQIDVQRDVADLILADLLLIAFFQHAAGRRGDHKRQHIMIFYFL